MTKQSPTRRIIGRIRGTANVALLIGAIVILIAIAGHWPPEVIAPIGLLTITAFLISFIAIIIENRLTPDEEEPR